MKKILFIICLALTLAGCKTITDIKPDTIVDIPLRPTEAATEEATQMTTAPAETEPQPTGTVPPTEAVTEAPTEKPATGKPTGSNSGGGKTPGKENSGSKPAATEPPTQPPTIPPTEPPTAAPTQPPTEAPTAPPDYDPSGYSPGGLDRAVADAVNAQRRDAGLEELTFDARLCAIASVRAWELAEVWSHTRPDGSDGLTVLSQYGYGYGWAAENLHHGSGGGEKIVERWMRNKTTTRNVLSESAAVIGVGSYTAPDGRTYVAAIFVG